MKIYRLITLAFALSFLVPFVYSQNKTRTLIGVVKSFEESFPLEGVSVIAKGTNKSSGTQSDGVYYISVSEKDSILLFSLPGYQAQEIKITEGNEYNVMLKAANLTPAVIRWRNYSYTRNNLPYLRCSMYQA